MKDSSIRFVKKRDDSTDRYRLDFDEVVEHCPELGNRVALIRSRVKDLRKNFRSDSIWALGNFNRITGITIATAIAGVISGVILSVAYPSAGVATLFSVAIGAAVGIAGAASKAFGLHKRYHAMFQAQWAMAALELRIESFVHDIIIGIEKGSELSEQDRSKVGEATESWLRQMDVILATFGDTYGAAFSPVEIKVNP
jgi:hypothetical protein